MKASVVGYKKKHILPILKKQGFKIVKKNPQIVFALGGDGTFLYSEEIYPGIPKVFIYNSDSCKSCSINNFEAAVKAAKKMKMKKLMKLDFSVGKKKFSAINDINVHYKPPRALRFSVKVNKKIVAKNVIGDGIIVSTPFGSQAYFKSITGKSFSKGIGIAFNNPTNKMKPIIVKETSKIEIKIIRESCVVAFDTSKKLINAKKGNKIKIKKGKYVKAMIFKEGGKYGR